MRVLIGCLLAAFISVVQPLSSHYTIAVPIYPLVRVLFPKYVTTTEQVGRAMIKVAKQGAQKSVLENWDINSI